MQENGSGNKDVKAWRGKGRDAYRMKQDGEKDVQEESGRCVETRIWKRHSKKKK